MGFRHAESSLDQQIVDSSLSSTKSVLVHLGVPSIDSDLSSIPSHTLGIKPAGNAYTMDQNIKAVAGGLFATLPDELLVKTLEYLDAAALQQVGCTCKALYAFSRLEDLWKTLYIE